METSSSLQENLVNRLIQLNEPALQGIKFHEWSPVSAQLARALRGILGEAVQEHEMVEMQLTSILALSEILGCCEMDVFDALYELKHQYYSYQLHGIDSPILLWDPLKRTSGKQLKARRFRWFKTWIPQDKCSGFTLPWAG
jgi:hypothetical protein